MTESNGNSNNNNNGNIDVPTEQLPEPPPAPPAPPDLDDLLGALKYPIKSAKVAKLFDRAPRPAPVGETNRKIVTYTITPETDDQWRDFLQTSTGTTPQRGKGISSAMVELAMQALMAVVAEFKPGEVAAALREISTSNVAREKMVANLNRLAAELG